jgi:putative transposase
VTSPGRRSIRLPGFDCSQPGVYFVTINTHWRQPLFSKIVEGKVVLFIEGRIVEEEWLRTGNIRKEASLDK